MGYAAVLGGKPHDLLETAEARWSAIRERRPELAPALELQRRLLTLVAGLADGISGGRVPRLSLPPKYLAAKLTRGVPIFAGEPIPLPVPLLAPALLQLCDALADGGAGETATHIREAIANGDIEPGSLLAASLARNQPAIRTGATHRGLAPDLVWLVAELAVSPFVHLLQRMLLADAKDDALRSALDAWSRGYCPACGSWPALAEVAGGHRTLRCSFCSSAAPDEDRKDRRIEVCGACGGYLKTMDVAVLSPFPLLSISDIETTDLDIAAMEHGYQRPALKELATPR
jgi:FdhE protein